MLIIIETELQMQGFNKLHYLYYFGPFENFFNTDFFN